MRVGEYVGIKQVGAACRTAARWEVKGQSVNLRARSDSALNMFHE